MDVLPERTVEGAVEGAVEVGDKVIAQVKFLKNGFTHNTIIQGGRKRQRGGVHHG